MCMVMCFSHIGNSRNNQEDNYLLGRRFLSPKQVNLISQNKKVFFDSKKFVGDYCVAVSDGMGGYEYGEMASLLTVQYLSSHYDKLIKTTCKWPDNLNDFVVELNRFVCSEAKKKNETQNMGATLCGVVAIDNSIFCFNIGDSRAYQFTKGLLKQITVDNTEGQRLLDLGLLTQEELKTFPKRKAIYKYIGKDVELIPDSYELQDIEKGTLLLLCSDGLSDVLGLEEIQDILSKQFICTKDKGKFLVEMAVERKPGAGDNITLLIIEY